MSVHAVSLVKGFYSAPILGAFEKLMCANWKNNSGAHIVIRMH